MQHYLNDVQMNKVFEVLADSPNKTTHSILILDPLNAAHMLIISYNLQVVIIYFDVHSSSVII